MSNEIADFFDFGPLLAFMRADKTLVKWADTLPEHLEAFLFQRKHGDIPKWLAALAGLPDFQVAGIHLNSDAITIDPPSNWTSQQREQLHQALQGLHPWRKGPFQIADVFIDTEWRSDWKWDRVQPGITSLKGRRVLDIGCGSGYHCWRMAGEGAELVIGVDPSLLFLCQFQTIQRYVQHPKVHLLPVGVQHIPSNLKAFDTTFSMGVFYHRSAPFEHLQQLKDTLRDGGELVLETLVIEGGLGDVLVPEGRYASMNNVWFLPSVLTMESWLRKAGFSNIQCINVDKTSTEEQRNTDWMRFYSLTNYLDPNNPDLTIEGHPAPIRATFVANA